MKSLTTRAYLTAHDRESIFVRVDRREDWGRGEEGISKVRETRVVVKFTATRTCSFLFYGEEDHYLIWKSIVGIIVHFLFRTVFFWFSNRVVIVMLCSSCWIFVEINASSSRIFRFRSVIFFRNFFILRRIVGI